MRKRSKHTTDPNHPSLFSGLFFFQNNLIQFQLWYGAMKKVHPLSVKLAHKWVSSRYNGSFRCVKCNITNTMPVVVYAITKAAALTIRGNYNSMRSSRKEIVSLFIRSDVWITWCDNTWAINDNASEWEISKCMCSPSSTCILITYCYECHLKTIYINTYW